MTQLPPQMFHHRTAEWLAVTSFRSFLTTINNTNNSSRDTHQKSQTPSPSIRCKAHQSTVADNSVSQIMMRQTAIRSLLLRWRPAMTTTTSRQITSMALRRPLWSPSSLATAAERRMALPRVRTLSATAAERPMTDEEYDDFTTGIVVCSTFLSIGVYLYIAEFMKKEVPKYLPKEDKFLKVVEEETSDDRFLKLVEAQGKEEAVVKEDKTKDTAPPSADAVKLFTWKTKLHSRKGPYWKAGPTE